MTRWRAYGLFMPLVLLFAAAASGNSDQCNTHNLKNCPEPTAVCQQGLAKGNPHCQPPTTPPTAAPTPPRTASPTPPPTATATATAPAGGGGGGAPEEEQPPRVTPTALPRPTVIVGGLPPLIVTPTATPERELPKALPKAGN